MIKIVQSQENMHIRDAKGKVTVQKSYAEDITDQEKKGDVTEKITKTKKNIKSNKKKRGNKLKSK